METTRILVVDDEKAIRDILIRSLHGRYEVLAVDSGEKALEAITASEFQIALLDIQMPGMDGIQLLEHIGKHSPDTAVVIISGVNQVDTALATIQKGAFDYVTKPFSIKVLESRVQRALERRSLILDNRAYQQNLEKLVSERTQALEEALGRIRGTYDETIKALGVALDLRDSETEHHCLRVANFVLKLARRAGIEDSRTLKDIEWGAYLHDIGKIGVPDAILLKPDRLTPEELEVIKTHPLLGYEMLKRIDFLRGAASVVLSHHESYDGSGYPHGLKGEQIPISARLFAIADTIDAMTTERPYRSALSIEEVGRELKAQAGKQFDPTIVEVFFSFPPQEWTL